MQIEKSYEENIITSPYQSVKIGLTVKSDHEFRTAEDLEKGSNKLLEIAKNIVQKELEKIKNERING